MPLLAARSTSTPATAGHRWTCWWVSRWETVHAGGTDPLQLGGEFPPHVRRVEPARDSRAASTVR